MQGIHHMGLMPPRGGGFHQPARRIKLLVAGKNRYFHEERLFCELGKTVIGGMGKTLSDRKNMNIQTGKANGAPFAQFVHCPRCGKAALSRLGERAVHCAACGFQYYFNSATAVGALLFHQGRLVLGVRGEDPHKGMLDFPGGFVEFDESAEEALRREVREELNITIANPTYLVSAPNDYLYAGILYKTTDVFFVCETGDISTLQAGDDVAAYQLADPATLDPLSLAFPSSRLALKRLLELPGGRGLGGRP
jgi:ADP-ribose pyrophosphatase YjhB (NUDIX family)